MMQRTITALSAFILYFAALTAQTPTPYQNFSKDPRVYTGRKSFWFEGNINGTLKKTDSGRTRLQYQLDWQYRRSSDASYIKDGEHLNIFKDMSQHVLRPWLHYWAIPGKVRLSVSPIGQWGTWSPEAEGPKMYNTEYRSTYQLTLFQKFGKLELQQRYRFEFRFNGDNQARKGGVSDMIAHDNFGPNAYKNRLRYMLRANYPISKSGDKYIALWDEVFLGMGKHVSNSKIFDQNRLVALFGKKIKNSRCPMKVELGFTWQLAPKYNIEVPVTQDITYGSYMKNNWESNLCFQVYFIFDEFHKLFKKP